MIHHTFVAILALVVTFTGCSPEPTVQDKIELRDSVEQANATLQSWGGKGTWLCRYPVTIPAEPIVAEDESADTDPIDVPSQEYTLNATDEGQSPEVYQVVDPSNQPPDGYCFGKRTIVLHGNTTISDIEIIFHGGGGKSTDLSTFGHQELRREDFAL